MIEKIAQINELLINMFKLIYINLLWIMALLLGFIVFTAGPATYAATAIIHRKLYLNDSFPIAKTFLFYFKEKFKESFIISWIYFLMGHILVIDLIYMHNVYFKACVIFISFFYTISLLYIFPIMAHYHTKGILNKIKISFLIGFGSLQYSLILIAFLILFCWGIVKFIPGFILIFGINLILFPTVWIARQVFSRNEGSTAFYKENTKKENEV